MSGRQGRSWLYLSAMYSPKHYRDDDPELAMEIMQRFDFATLITSGRELQITHLPLMPEAQPDGRLELVGHLARANPHWREFTTAPVTALFHGPHAYISPAWYEPDAANVPTWNYAVVHATGMAHVIEDGIKAEALMRQLVTRFEGRYGTGWSMPSVAGAELARLLEAIVVFRVRVEQLEAKFKMSQNQVARNREGAIRGLESLANDEARAVVDLMRRVKR